MTTIENWFKSLPPFTKHYFVAVCVTSTLTTLKLLSPWKLVLDIHKSIVYLQVWRLATCFIYFGD